MTAKNLNELSDNSIMELRSLLGRIQTLIDRDYCHVQVNTNLLKALQTNINQVEKEVCKREL